MKRAMPVQRKWVAAAVLGSVAAIGWWTTSHVFDGSGALLPGLHGAAPSLFGAAPDDAASANATAASSEQIRHRLFDRGSLAGTELAGNWCVTDAHQLHACSGLRERFESYLLGLGEASPDELRSLVHDDARRDLGATLGAAVMSVWDRYWQLRTYAWRNRIDPDDRRTWLAVLDEQHRVREQLLGADWATAFFADEEARTRADHARLEANQPAPADPGDPVPQMGAGQDPSAVQAARVARYGEAGAARLAQVDADWAAWSRRLDTAREQWGQLQQAANLSDLQRQAAMRDYVQGHFSASEQRRVSALLNLP